MNKTQTKRTSLLFVAALSVFALAGCDEEPVVPDDIFGALGEPLPTSTPAQLDAFNRGHDVATRRFTREDGLGPHFNVSFCGACHEKPVFGGSAGRYRNFLIVGAQLPDGSFTPTSVNGVQPQFELNGSRFPSDEATNHAAVRNPIPFFGIGLLAEIPEENILANADEEDTDGDGISGRSNFDRGFVGRFGRKSQTTSIEGFIRGPLFNHLGITSVPLSQELKAALPVPSQNAEDAIGESSSALRDVDDDIAGQVHAQAAAPDEPTEDDDGIPDPELSQQDLFDLVSFAMLLAAPTPDPLTPRTREGKQAFEDAQCNRCHVEALESPRGLIPAYSDLLLHDMGEELADGVTMNRARGSEFRTQPLWGIASVGPFLHDGRADTLDDAIRMHGGEGSAARDAYIAMSTEKQDTLLAFLVSLGGASQYTEGLVPPGEDVPTTGYGAPLPGTDLPTFARTRRAFDRDQPLSEGLGPIFNGDTCRACHFEPTIGGAGPAGVDVIRHGRYEGDEFNAPDFGTVSHRHATDATRPPFLDLANEIETRQTPHLFGAGLIDAIAESTIRAGEDPDDADGDGIRGRAHILPDGRVGRFGWKADVPNLSEFARDAVSVELGLTVPPSPDHAYGTLNDDDDTPDPEIDESGLADIVFFMATLGAPPRTSTNATLEARGDEVFSEVGCDSCHTRELPTDRGQPVPLFSDLLLHDVASADARGIPSFNASPREMRTAPLWGLATSAPYLHNGRAFSIEEAIAAHATEAEMSRAAYEALSAENREALLAFLGSL